MTWWDVTFWGSVFASAVRLATPIALAAIGETIVERSGTKNKNKNGIMTIGAFAAIFIESVGGGWGLALVVSLLVGAIFGLAIALAVLRGGANQIIIGIAASLIGSGLAVYFYQLWDGSPLASQFCRWFPLRKFRPSATSPSSAKRFPTTVSPPMARSFSALSCCLF